MSTINSDLSKRIRLKNESGEILRPEITKDDVIGLTRELNDLTNTTVNKNNLSTINGISLTNGGNIVVTAQPISEYVIYKFKINYPENNETTIELCPTKIMISFNSRLYYRSEEPDSYILASALNIGDKLYFENSEIKNYYVLEIYDSTVVLAEIREKNGIAIVLKSGETTGTLVNWQLALLQDNNINYLVQDKKIYRLQDNEYSTNVLVYTNIGLIPETNSDNATEWNNYIINIFINKTTGAWTKNLIKVQDPIGATYVSNAYISLSGVLTLNYNTGSAATYQPLKKEKKTISWFNGQSIYLSNCVKIYYTDTSNNVYQVFYNWTSGQTLPQFYYFANSGEKCVLTNNSTELDCIVFNSNY